jgi:hypothetical protein
VNVFIGNGRDELTRRDISFQRVQCPLHLLELVGIEKARSMKNSGVRARTLQIEGCEAPIEVHADAECLQRLGGAGPERPTPQAKWRFTGRSAVRRFSITHR